jgi:hypothetical protein
VAKPCSAWTAAIHANLSKVLLPPDGATAQVVPTIVQAQRKLASMAACAAMTTFQPVLQGRV